MNDPDAIWKPGYDGPPPIVEAPREPTVEQSSAGTNRAGPERRSRGRRFGIGVGVGLVLIALVAVFDPPGSRDASTGDGAPDASAPARPTDEGASAEPTRPVIEGPDPSVFGGSSARRLPAVAATLWSVDIEHDGGAHWVDVVGRELAIAALDASTAALPGTTIVAFDAPTGEQRWTLQLAARPIDVTVVGAVDDVLVLEQPGVTGPTATGVDVTTGEIRWSSDAAPSDGHIGLLGTPFIARLPLAPDRFVSLIDAPSGRDVGWIGSDPSATGRPGGWSTDRRGTWFVIDEGVVVAYDLTAELGEPTVIGALDDATTPGIVVDGRLVVVDDSGSITFVGAGAGGPPSVSAEVPAPVRSLTQVSGSSFVVTAPGSIAGVSIERNSLDVTWSENDGALVNDHPVEGGTLVQVATRGGAQMQLVDGLTGETVEHLTMVPGALQALLVAGDGYVALRASAIGPELAGIDLDGAERWSIAGSAPVVVGDRIVVRAVSDEVVDGAAAAPSQQLSITVYGDAE